MLKRYLAKKKEEINDCKKKHTLNKIMNQLNYCDFIEDSLRWLY